MKPIIFDIQDISDSVEVYESKPSKAITYFIYTLLALLIVAVVWMYFFKIDIHIKNDGLFKSDQEPYDVCSEISGEVGTCNVSDGEYVNAGDTILTILSSDIDSNLENYEKSLSDINDRLQILTAYQQLLDGDETSFDSMVENKYYAEFCNRRNLLTENINSKNTDVDSQKAEYQKNIDAINTSINEYNSQIEKLQETETCIRNRENSFDLSESYYFSIVNSYLAQYESTSTQYNNKIAEYNNNIDSLNRQIDSLNIEKEQLNDAQSNVEDQQLNNAQSNVENQQLSNAQSNVEEQQLNDAQSSVENQQSTGASGYVSNLESATYSVMPLSINSDVNTKINSFIELSSDFNSANLKIKVQTTSTNIQNTKIQDQNILSGYYKKSGETVLYLSSESQTTANSIDDQINELQTQIKTQNSNIASAQSEKEKALASLELTQLSTIEQQIESIKASIQTLNTNLTSEKAQMDALTNSGLQTSSNISNLSEKGAVASELLDYTNQKKECENSIKDYNIQKNKCTINADESGYIALSTDLKVGSFLSQGSSICQIYPKEAESYYAEIYVKNANIGKVKIGQEVNFEVAAYPSSEYGYFTGTVENISEDIKTDSSGNSYYLVKATCKNTSVKNKQGDVESLRNGMACQANIIVDNENVLQYLLKKIDLID